MKRSLIPFLSLLLSLSLLLCGCGQNSGNTNDSGNASDTDGAIDETLVVATVNGTDIYYGDFAKQMATVESMYSSLTGTLSAEEINQKLTEQAKSVLDNLINQVILEQKAVEYGMTLSADQEAEVNAAWENVQDRFAETVQANYPTFTGEDLDAMVLLALESSGFTEEMVMESARTSALIANLRAHIDSEVSPATEAEIQSLYNTLLSEQQTEFETNASAFEAAMLGSTVVVYIPADYRVIQEWEFRFDNDTIALLNQMEEIDTEESTAYEEVLESERSLLQTKIDAVRTRLAAGDSFDAVYAELNPDGAPKSNYISGSTTRFSSEYYSAAMSIETLGAVADSLVPLNYGYYLLCWADTLEKGVIPISEVEEALAGQLLTERQNANWQTVQAQWREEAQITINEELITY